MLKAIGENSQEVQADHVVKSWCPFFQAIISGQKRHDLRDMKDRHYKVGDIIQLQEYDFATGEYTGMNQYVRVTFITSRETPCAFSSAVLDKDYAILSLELIAGPWRASPQK